MKLLLTSAGIRNRSLASALEDLVGKIPAETRVGFVPTSANAHTGNKDWFISQLSDLQRFGFAWIDIVDFAAPGIDWRKRLNTVDVLFVSGGNTFYLLDQCHKSGFDVWLRQNLERIIYVGSSAGSILLTPSIAIATVEPADENPTLLKDFSALHIVDFEISPHSPNIVSYEHNEKYAKNLGHTLYAIDDETGIKIFDGRMEIVSEGKWRKMGK